MKDAVLRKLAEAQEETDLGLRALRRGMYDIAAVRFAYAEGVLSTLAEMVEDGTIPATKTFEKTLNSLILAVRAAAQKIRLVSGNGRRNPKRGGIAVADLLEEYLSRLPF